MGSPNRDSAFDAGIIAHEYCHGLSKRLTGGAMDVNCLKGDQHPGEGWSDFCGLFFTAVATDTAITPRGIGPYVKFQPPNGPDMRPFPYSTDMAVNPLTYGDIITAGSGPGTLTIPHGVGHVWAVALWEVYWQLVSKWGFDSNLYTGTGGNKTSSFAPAGSGGAGYTSSSYNSSGSSQSWGGGGGGGQYYYPGQPYITPGNGGTGGGGRGGSAIYASGGVSGTSNAGGGGGGGGWGYGTSQYATAGSGGSGYAVIYYAV